MGVIFELTPHSNGIWKEKVLHSFSGTDGMFPAGLIFDHKGNLYGGTDRGGRAGEGTVFKLAPGSKGEWREEILHSFRKHPGALPSGALIFDDAGNLYGTTEGEYPSYGSVFEITP
jgi:uncharacterized repeat protein (TIGR03803 family)